MLFVWLATRRHYEDLSAAYLYGRVRGQNGEGNMVVQYP